MLTYFFDLVCGKPRCSCVSERELDHTQQQKYYTQTFAPYEQPVEKFIAKLSEGVQSLRADGYDDIRVSVSEDFRDRGIMKLTGSRLETAKEADERVAHAKIALERERRKQQELENKYAK